MPVSEQTPLAVGTILSYDKYPLECYQIQAKGVDDAWSLSLATKTLDGYEVDPNGSWVIEREPFLRENFSICEDFSIANFPINLE